MSASGAASPPDALALASLFDEYKYGPGRNISIVRSSSAIVSAAASALLVWIIVRSRNGMKTTHHRLLLGLSLSDVLLSLSFATFGAVVPSELNYVVWNARGSRASCDAFGFIAALGLFSGLLYMCSLNLYYLATVKFNKTDAYIARKLERWLHGVPTSFGLIVSVVILAKQGMNASINGLCDATNTHEPPHCDGLEDGDTPEGFEIPCGRGRSAEPIAFVAGGVTTFLVPITIGGSLWTIYRAVLSAEQRTAQYGAGALHANRAQPTTNDADGTSVEGGDDGGGRSFGRSFSILSSVSSRFGGTASRDFTASRTTSSNLDSSQRDAATTDVEGGDDGGQRALLILSSISSRFGGRASRIDYSNQGSSQNNAATTGVEGGGHGRRASFSIPSTVERRERGDNGRRASFSIPSTVERREGGDNGCGGSFSILSRRSEGRASEMSSSNRNSSKSRAVLQKAAAYSVAYLVTWIWLILYVSLILVGAWTSELPQPKWQIGYVYVWSFFGPLQGLWTFLIYMQPKVIRKKRSSNVSWFRAFADAL